MGIGTSMKETTLHYYRDPLVEVLSEDSDAVGGGTYTGDGYTLAFTLENNEITITGFSADSDFDGSVVLDKFEGYSIVAIEDNVFQTTELKSIVLPETLRTIGEQAFRGSKLTQLIIPNSVTSIGQAAFSGCQDLELLIIGENVMKL